MTLATALASVMILGILLPGASLRADSARDNAGGIVRTYTTSETPSSPSISIQLTTDRAHMTVADRLVMTISVTAAPGASITTPEVGDTLGGFTVASSEVAPAADGSAQRTMRLVLEPFLSGTKSIPALTFRAIKDGKSAAVTSEPISIPVSDVLTLKEGQAPPIAAAKPPLDLIEPARRRWPAILLGGLAAGAYVGAFGIARLSAHRRKKSTDPVVAFRDILDRADAQCNADAGGEATAHALESVAGGLRSYIQQHLHIPAIGSSAPELVHRARNSSHLPNDLRAAIERLVTGLETARFSPDGATPDRARTLIAEAQDLLRKTSGPTATPSSASASREVAA